MLKKKEKGKRKNALNCGCQMHNVYPIDIDA